MKARVADCVLNQASGSTNSGFSLVQISPRILWLTCVLFSSFAFGMPPLSAKAMVAGHNKVRSKHGLPRLVWSERLARNAAEWADHLAEYEGCKMRHATDTGEGENLFWASPMTWTDGRKEVQRITSAEVVKSWASEESNYDYKKNRCLPGKMCGHYTQIVWKQTTEMGCAAKVCADKAQIWVCRYLPPGNWIGQKPY